MARDVTVRADLDGAQLNGMQVDPSTLKITKISTPDSPLRVGDQIFAINGERVELNTFRCKCFYLLPEKL